MSKTIVLIDAKNALFRFGFANRLLHTSAGIWVGALHGILKSLLRIKYRYPTSQFCMVWDGQDGAKWRKSICPEYKANRTTEIDPIKKAIFSQIEPLKKILNILQVPNFEVDGVEADDIISICGHYAKAQGFDVIVNSGDKDFWQLIPYGFMVVTKVAKGEGLHEVNKGDIWKEFRCSAEELLKVRAIAGDSSDNIKGALKGIGSVKAAKLVKAGINPELINFKEHSISASAYDILCQLETVWAKVHNNYRVMKLPQTYQLRRYSFEQQEQLKQCCGSAVATYSVADYKQTLAILREYELHEVLADRHTLIRIQIIKESSEITIDTTNT